MHNRQLLCENLCTHTYEKIKKKQENWKKSRCIKLVFTQIRKLLDSDKPIKENEYNLELIDKYLLDKDPQELSKNAAEIVMAAELIDNYLLDKRFMRELEDRDEYDAA